MLRNLSLILGGSLVLFSSLAWAKSEKIDLDGAAVDFVAVRGTPYAFEYFVDRKARLCFGVRAQALAVVPCEALLKGYPSLKSVIDWK